MKKLIALLLVLVMVLALVACGNDDAKKDEGTTDPTTSTTAPPADPTDPPADPTDPSTEPSIQFKNLPGSWGTTLSFTGEMMGVPAFTGTLDMTVVVEFTEDGTYTLSVDTDALNTSIQNNKDALVAGILQLLYDTYGGEDAAEQQVQASMNMSCAEYAAEYVESLKDELSMDEEKGTWRAESSWMYLDGELIAVVIRGNEMTWFGPAVEESFGAEEVVFTRIAA